MGVQARQNSHFCHGQLTSCRKPAENRIAEYILYITPPIRCEADIDDTMQHIKSFNSKCCAAVTIFSTRLADYRAEGSKSTTHQARKKGVGLG